MAISIRIFTILSLTSLTGVITLPNSRSEEKEKVLVFIA